MTQKVQPEVQNNDDMSGTEPGIAFVNPSPSKFGGPKGAASGMIICMPLLGFMTEIILLLCSVMLE